MKRGEMNKAKPLGLLTACCNHKWKDFSQQGVLSIRCPILVKFFSKDGMSNYIRGFAFHDSNFKSYVYPRSMDVNSIHIPPLSYFDIFPMERRYFRQ